MDEYLAFAKDLARQGGQLIKDNFESNLSVELKGDHTPVTQVDKQINQLVITTIRSKYPEHGVLGEEADESNGEEYQWVCDPIDGTAPFIMGVKTSTFILGLAKDGQFLLSVVYNPYDDKLYYAVRGEGAFCDGRKLRVDSRSLKESFVIYDNSSHSLYDKLTAAGAVMEPCPGAGYRAMLLAQGRLSAIVQCKADHHDVGPASLIIEEAGGKVTLFDGTTPRYDQPIQGGLLLSNGTCHDELLQLVA